MKKMVMILLCVMLLSALAIGGESNATTANPGWYNCTINSVGADTSGTYYIVNATSSDTTWAGVRVFFVDGLAAGGKGMLATILTGYASSGSVALYLPSSQNPYTYIGAVTAGVMP
jgi:hypothetical protein